MDSLTARAVNPVFAIMSLVDKLVDASKQYEQAYGWGTSEIASCCEAEQRARRTLIHALAAEFYVAKEPPVMGKRVALVVAEDE